MYICDGRIIIMFGLVCDRLGSHSDLVKSWGGSVTVACRVPRRGWAYGPHYNLIYVDWSTRSYHSAVSCQGVYKWRETRVYIEWWAATWSIYFIVERAERKVDSLCDIYMKEACRTFK